MSRIKNGSWSKLLEGKMGRGKKEPSPSPSIDHQAKNLLLLLPLATKPRTFSFSFHWPPNQEPSPSPSIDHQAKNLLLLLPLTTKPRSFTLSLKGRLGSWEGVLLFPRKTNFNSILRVFVWTSFLKRGGRISFGVGERKENRMRIL